jgi:ABC-2 type transport system ATP-binding protein
LITVTNYAKYYDATLVLAIENQSFNAGIHWLLGKNGSGKSTLFKSIVGIIPFEGNISINGMAAGSIAAKKLLGFSEAEPNYPSSVSAYDILSFIAEVRSADMNFLEKIVKDWGVELYWKQAVHTYSSGMLKKISLISAFLGSPTWILLDEPFILIDAATVSKLQELISYFAEHWGSSFIISSHQTFELATKHTILTYQIENKQIVNYEG